MQESIMEQWLRTSHISGGNAAYVEDLYDTYLHDPNAVPTEWRDYFDQLPRIEGVVTQDVPHSVVREHFELLGRNRARPVVAPGSGGPSFEHESKQIHVVQLISSYRFRGHQKAKLDPLGLMVREQVPDLQLGFHGLTQADLDTAFQTANTFFGKDEAPLREIIEALEQTYCGSVGPEIMHITNFAEKQWLQQRLESVRSKPVYDPEFRTRILERLTAAEGLERHLDSKFPGTKRFGLEGGESFIPLLDGLIRRAGEHGAKEIVLGMAHRGRLNTLVNTLGKRTADLFEEFEGKRIIDSSGDVKYHQGFSSNVMTPGGEVHLAMSFNPSHLEIVSPVVEGSVRARQDRREDPLGNKVVPISVHGDAAFAGQGVVMETFQMSQTRAYGTGGTIHIVINNQVGFTTSRREDARSTEYCTDVAKVIEAPILHVNADDPEAVLFVTLLAMDYRYEFKKDVVIDLVCYRRRGHNETDEPSATQPLMYKAIRNHKTTRTLYAEKLVNEGVLSQADADQMATDYRAALDRGEHVAQGLVSEPDKTMFVDWTPYIGHDWYTPADTSYDLKALQELATKMCEIPDGIQVQRQVTKIYDDRRKMAGGALPINWGMAETLAYATLLTDDVRVRLTGQDVGRGTFSHRHVVIHNQKDGSSYEPLAHLSDDQREFDIYDSLLSEEAVLAFEYGYATTSPNALVIWEAQFGDFANGAQVVIDQFITSGEHKWGRLCGLTMLLPHGYEGQGPEHSSARLERFMQLCAEHNIQVCIPTTPAQVFHMLRRQAIRPMRRPLVVMSPKWILRHKLATSSLEELANGRFQNVIGEQELQPEGVKRAVLCSGKVYYHLLEARMESGQTDVALIRLEQLYPFPSDELAAALQPFSNLKEVVWCQEEPMNQGCWYSSQHHMRRVVDTIDKSMPLLYAGREPSAAPAAGYMSVHLEEQSRFVEQALTVS
ncbi:MAG: 2-oxoglutarate dehydrogenase E1 component [Gammaproteobacteria bacterium]|uniref:2-oxoglutarate dehydrogenase E1 component n=1 Tax=Pseudomaricurvus alcaniphilus TaxID=1166482 RepID=UPI00140CD86E|nr:2-oxoglutarate dehydrogenase E1 component [Pseudomaricurvus alcaniphilus]MBR9912483.1 2-oxoglutarate dehydrogenase E1 component [Gammaproteobacteria bacterium]NHN37426.1 2-oxoglutarate dehydrogenase E1 component [Pseudomaricurvus alcaniphilus]